MDAFLLRSVIWSAVTPFGSVSIYCHWWGRRRSTFQLVTGSAGDYLLSLSFYKWTIQTFPLLFKIIIDEKLQSYI